MSNPDKRIRDEINRRGGVVSMTELGAICRTHGAPRHGDKWGRWRFDARRRELVIRAPGGAPYEIALDSCTTRTEVWDWVEHMAQKHWITNADLGALVRALETLGGVGRGAQGCGVPWV